MKRFVAISLILSSLLVGSVLPVRAHQTDVVNSEHIENFNSDITINKENVATITETIVYDFASLSRHGIYRYIPTRTKAGDSGKYYYYDFDFIKATADGAPVQVKESKQGDYEVLRLGDPDKTITGVHTYTISYNIAPVVERDADGDYFNWNITGNDWEVPIETATAMVTFPQGAEVLGERCYSGSTGSTASNCMVTGNANVLSSSATDLGYGQGLTVNALVTANSFSDYLAPSNPPATQWLPILGVIWGIFGLLLGLVIRLASWLRHKWRLRQEIVAPQYEAPDGLAPAEIGLLNDNRSNMKEITATIVDLAIRGHLKIEQSQAKGISKKPKYTFHKLTGKDNLRDFERTLMNMLFKNTSTIKLEDIAAVEARTAIDSIHRKLKKHMESMGYYVVQAKSAMFHNNIHRMVIVIILGVLALNVYCFIRGANAGLVIISSTVFIVLTLLGWLLAKRTELTPAGYHEWAEIEGLRLFLSVTEKERLAFHNAPAKSPRLFNKLLPYAIVLGVEREWAKQFQGIDVSTDADWYTGASSYTPKFMATSLANDFNLAINSNFTPAQTLSSSGGFSGGGGGGGGGGSW